MGVCSTCAICGAIHDHHTLYDANTVEKQAIHHSIINRECFLMDSICMLTLQIRKYT